MVFLWLYHYNPSLPCRLHPMAPSLPWAHGRWPCRRSPTEPPPRAPRSATFATAPGPGDVEHVETMGPWKASKRDGFYSSFYVDIYIINIYIYNIYIIYVYNIYIHIYINLFIYLYYIYINIPTLKLWRLRPLLWTQIRSEPLRTYIYIYTHRIHVWYIY